MAHQIAKYVVADEAVNKDVRDPVENEPFPVSIERVPEAPSPKKSWIAFWGLPGVVEWIRGFHEGYLERQAEMAPGAWVNALHPIRTPAAVPPALVVVMAPGTMSQGWEDRVSAAGALVYEKPSAVSFDVSADAGDWLRKELAESVRFVSDARHSLSASQEFEGGPVDLTSYTDPVYRLSEKDFEDLLRRSRIEDPLEVGE